MGIFPYAAKIVLDQVDERRLLTVQERGGVPRIEPAHDVLTRIVAAGREERHEIEALSQAQTEKERAVAETARIAKERNRLRRLAIGGGDLRFSARRTARRPRWRR